MTDSNAKAYPITDQYDRNKISGGLTKREYFAALALQGILSDPNVCKMDKAAKNAVQAADFLIQELNEA